MHEFEEVSKNQSKKGITEYGKSVENFYFGCNSTRERKMAPGHVPRSCFVYSLKHPIMGAFLNSLFNF
jgi:hypothetical protein